MLKRLKELAVQSANGTYSNEERFYMQTEAEDILREINRIAAATDFNGIKLLDGSVGMAGSTVISDTATAGTPATLNGAATDHAADPSIHFQVGAANANANSVYLSIGNMSAGVDGLGLIADNSLFVEPTEFALATGLFTDSVSTPVLANNTTSSFNVTTIASAKFSIDRVDGAISSVSEQRAKLGSMQNRLEHTVNSLTVTNENIQAAESQIRDTDMAKEMVNYTKYSILQQAAQAMLAQANQAPQAILQLLR
jgi:flagellin